MSAYRLAFIAAGCFVLGACATAPSEGARTAAVAPESSETTQTVVGESRLDPDKMICKRQKVTGSRLGGREVCKTRREWDQQSAEARRGADRFINNSGGINTDGVQ